MKEPVRAPDQHESDADRKRRLARERQRRHREKLRRTAAANSAAQQNRHVQPQQAQDPVPRQQSAPAPEPRRRSMPDALTSTFPDHSYQQPKTAAAQHTQANVLHFQRSQQEHEQGSGVVVASMDTANLGHIRPQSQKRQPRKKAYSVQYPQDKQILRDQNSEGMAHPQQQPHQRRHADVLSVQKQSKSQSFQFPSPPLNRNQPISGSREQQHNLRHQQQQQDSQPFPGPQLFSGHQKRQSEEQRNARLLVSGQQVLQEHQTRSPIHQRQPSHSAINHDPSNLSYSVSVLPPEQIPRRSNRDTGDDVRGQQQNYPQSDHLQQVNTMQTQRVRQQRMQETQGHIQGGSPHRPHAHVSIALHSQGHQPGLFVSQQLPSQSPQPPPLQPQQSRNRTAEAHRQGHLYAQRDRSQADHAFQHRRSIPDDELHQVAHLEAGRHIADLGRSGRKDDYRFGGRPYPDNQMSFLDSVTGIPQRTPDRQSILNEHHLQDRSGDNRVNRTAQAGPSQGQMRKPDMASHRNQPQHQAVQHQAAQHQAAQQHAHLDMLASNHHVSGQQFSLASQEPAVPGYLQNHQQERQSAAQVASPTHNSTQSQAIYLQHGHGSASSPQHAPPLSRSKNDSLVAAASLTALPTAVNGIHASAALGHGPENGGAIASQRASLPASQAGYATGLNFNVFAQGSVPKDVNASRSRSALNILEAIQTSTAGETTDERKRRLARERQRRRRKRLKREVDKSNQRDDAKTEDSSIPVNAASAAMSQGNYSMNANVNAGAEATPEAVRVPPVHADGPVHVGFGQDHLASDQQAHALQHVPGGVSKQGAGRSSFDGHALSGSQTRGQHEQPASMSALPQFGVAGGIASTPPRNANVATDGAPPNETAEDRKRRLARERQRRRRDKLRKTAEAARTTGEESTVMASAIAGSSGMRTSTGAGVNNMTSASRTESGRVTRHSAIGSAVFAGRPGGGQPVFGNGDERRISRVNVSDRGVGNNLNTMQRGQVLPAGTSEVTGAGLGLAVAGPSGLGRGGNVGGRSLIRWDEVYNTQEDARYAVNAAVSGFRGQLENVSATERMFIVQHGIVQLAAKEGLPREKLDAILRSAVSAE